MAGVWRGNTYMQKAPRVGLIVWVLNGNEIYTLSVVGGLVFSPAVPYRGLLFSKSFTASGVILKMWYESPSPLRM